MPKNEFKAFAVGENANVLTQTEYENLPAVTSGFQAGIAESVQLNKVWRQASVIAAMLGQFTADKSGDDVVDDGKLDVLMNSFVKALFNNSTEQLDPRYLKKDQNLADVPDKTAGRASLDVYSKTESNENYMAKSQNGADIPDKPKFIQNLGLKETLNPTKRVSIGNIGTGAFDGSTPCINIGDSDSGFVGSADGVLDIYCNNAKVGYIDNAGLHMSADILTTGAIHTGNATFDADGNIFGTRWNPAGAWLWDTIVDTFSRKNTASLQDWGWVRDESTGFIMQWGTLGSSNGTYNFPRAFPASCFAVFVTNTSAQGSAVDNAFGYPVSNSQFFAATKRSDMNAVGSIPVAWFAIGR